MVKKLGFESKIIADADEKTLKDVFKKYSNAAIHQDSDAFLCFILSHGKLGEFYSVDNKSIKLIEIYRLFYSNNCHTLRNKPKCFFIQACQNRLNYAGNCTNHQTTLLNCLI